MDIQQAVDLTRQYGNTNRATDEFRPAFNTTYQLGACVKLASRDLQTWTDVRTIVPCAASTSDLLVVGIVSEDWIGFPGSPSYSFSLAGGVESLVNTSATSYTSAANTLTRGTQKVKATVYGYHPYALLDNSGAAVNVTNGTPLNPSSGTAGRMAPVATASYGSTIANAILPASGIGSSLGHGALVQASQTITLTGTPAAGDYIPLTIQIPYSQQYLGVAQTLTIGTTLTSAQAASVTTAAAAVAASLNANATFATFYTASNVAGVITVAVNALSSAFYISHTNGDYYPISLSGTIGNSITFSTAGNTGSTVVTAGGATLAGGTGFYGGAPVWITVL